MIFPSSLTIWGLRERYAARPLLVFQGRRVGPNSIFRDGIIPETANGCLVAGSCGPQEKKKKVKRYEGLKENATEDNRELKGNLRFPLDFTYHGCPQNSHLPLINRSEYIAHAK